MIKLLLVFVVAIQANYNVFTLYTGVDCTDENYGITIAEWSDNCVVDVGTCDLTDLYNMSHIQQKCIVSLDDIPFPHVRRLMYKNTTNECLDNPSSIALYRLNICVDDHTMYEMHGARLVNVRYRWENCTGPSTMGEIPINKCSYRTIDTVANKCTVKL